MSRIRIESIKDEKDFKELRSEWNDLLQISVTNSIFLTWEWLYSWWLSYANNKKLNILCARGGNNELLGVAPLFIHKTKYYKVPVIELTFLGDGASDRQDVIINKNHPELYEVFIEHIISKKNWHTARLEQVPEWSGLVSLKQFFEGYEQKYRQLSHLLISNRTGKPISKDYQRNSEET